MEFQPLKRVRAAANGGMLIVLLLAGSPAHAADPLLMFVLGFAKNLIESALERNAAQRAAVPVVPLAPAPVPLAMQKPAAQMDADDLRILVDESFSYLDRSQRAELLAGLDQALADPANTVQR